MVRFPSRPLPHSLTCALAFSLAAHAGVLIALRSAGDAQQAQVDAPGPPVELLSISPPPAAQPRPPIAAPPEPRPIPIDTQSPPTQPSAAASPSGTPAIAPAPPPSVTPPPQSSPESTQQMQSHAQPRQTSPATAQMVSLAGVDGIRASRIVYVLDSSGPMTSCFPRVKSELLRSVSRLSSEQTFKVIVTRRVPGTSQPAIESFPPAGFGPSTTAQHDRLAAWLAAVQPRGASDPWSGLEASIALQPDLVFLLTRSIRRSAGEDASAANARILARLDALNPLVDDHRAVVIKSLQFVDEDPSGLLRRIAELHGDGESSYRVIGMQDLGR